MNASSVFFLLVVLACPLMMIWMMRGGHGHGHGGHDHSGHDHGDDAHAPPMRERSTTGLRELRDEIDRMIEERDEAERDEAEREPAELEPPVGTRR
jgi:hypothetical protein